MRTLARVFQLLMLALVCTAASGSAFAQTLVGGAITSNQTWTAANSPYEVTSEIVVYNLARLTIEPGVEVRFRAGTGLVIGYYAYDYGALNYLERGALTVNGTAGAPVVFTSTAGTPGTWKGVAFGNATDYGGLTSTLSHLTIANAGQAQTLNGTVGATSAGLMLFNTGVGFSVTDLSVVGSSGPGLVMNGASLTMTGFVAAQNAGQGIYATLSDLHLSGGALRDNGAEGARLSQCGGALTGVEVDANGGDGVYLDASETAISASRLTDNALHAVSYGVATPPAFMLGNELSGNARPGIEVRGGPLVQDHRWALQQGEPVFDVTAADVTVFGGARLTIDAGVTVRFAAETGLTIGYLGYGFCEFHCAEPGSLAAAGAMDAPVVLTAASGVPGGWRGLAFGPAANPSLVSRVVIANAGRLNTLGGTVAPTQASIALFGSSQVLDQLTVARGAGHGIVAVGGGPTVRNSLVVAHAQRGLFATGGGDASFDHGDSFGNGSPDAGFALTAYRSIDPLLVDPAAGDFRLGVGSPVVNVGFDLGAPFVGVAPDLGACESPTLDADGDGVTDAEELAAGSDPFNPASLPEICDALDNDADGQVDEALADADADGICDAIDLCAVVVDPDQLDGDADGVGDACDNCPVVPNPDQPDADLDGYGDACDINTTCGNGQLDLVSPQFACPVPVTTTTVTTAAQLAQWLSGPRLTALRVTRAIDWGGALEIVTPCNVTISAALTATDLLISGGAVSVGAPIHVPGIVDLRGTTSAKATAAATFLGTQELDFESPVVDDRSSASLGRRYCAEGGTYYLGDAPHTGSPTAVAEIAGSNLRLGSFSGLRSLAVTATNDPARAQFGRIATRATSVLGEIAELSFTSEDTQVLAGSILQIGDASFTGLTPAAKLSTSATADLADVTGSVQFDTPGAVTFDGVWDRLGVVRVSSGGLLSTVSAIRAVDGTETGGWHLAHAQAVSLGADRMTLAGALSTLGSFDAFAPGALTLSGPSTLADGRVKPGLVMTDSGRTSFQTRSTLQANGVVSGAASVTTFAQVLNTARTSLIETSGDLNLNSSGAGNNTLYGVLDHDGAVRLRISGTLRLYGAITDSGEVSISAPNYRLFAGYLIGGNAACQISGVALAGSLPLVGCSTGAP